MLVLIIIINHKQRAAHLSRASPFRSGRGTRTIGRPTRSSSPTTRRAPLYAQQPRGRPGPGPKRRLPPRAQGRTLPLPPGSPGWPSRRPRTCSRHRTPPWWTCEPRPAPVLDNRGWHARWSPSRDHPIDSRPEAMTGQIPFL